MSAIDERIDLIEKILSNKISKKEVEVFIKEMENKYGEKAFTRFKFQKKEKPWNQDYYDKLKNLSMSGAGSKEFILHLVEVRDSINKFDKKKIIPVAIVAIVAVIIAIILFH